MDKVSFCSTEGMVGTEDGVFVSAMICYFVGSCKAIMESESLKTMQLVIGQLIIIVLLMVQD